MEILLVLVVGWLVITAAIGVVVRYGVERRARRPRHARRPGCANCGYPVQGLPRPRCPECGADLRATGVYYDIGV